MKYLAILLIIFSLPLYAGKIVPLPGLLVPNAITVGSERIYITEGASVHIYSLENPRFIKKFGREGEGPGELKTAIYIINIHPDHIILNSEGRVSYFTKDGEFIKQSTVSGGSVNYKSIKGGYVGMRMLPENGVLYFAINLYDAKMAKVKEIHRFKHPFGPRKTINPFDVRVCSYHVYDDKLFIDKENGTIDVYDNKGKIIYSIDPAIERVNVSKELEKRYMDLWASTRTLKAEYKELKERFRIPAYFPPIRNFQIVEGKIYILTYKEIDGKSEMLIYSLDGKRIKKTLVPLTDVDILLPQLYNYYTIKGDKLYLLVENPDSEEWELHISDL